MGSNEENCLPSVSLYCLRVTLMGNLKNEEDEKAERNKKGAL
jgi:hypothetical protein